MTISKRGTLISIGGPTGSGKSDLAVEVARRFNAPIISTDSRQVFRGLPIGTAQPTAEQLAAVKHYFIADREVTDEYNAGVFEKEALALLDSLFEQHEYVVAVGGSGLYINALCRGFDALPLGDAEVRRELEELLAEKGVEALAEELRKLDPAHYEVVDRNNPARLMRAIEVCRVSGLPYSEQRSGAVAERPFDIIKIGVKMERELLYERINKRVDLMIEAGLVEEAHAMLPYRHLNSLQTVGYKELFEYFDGNCSLEEAIELIKRDSRRYAKRQMTWFGSDEEISWFGSDEIDKIENFIKKFAE